MLKRLGEPQPCIGLSVAASTAEWHEPEVVVQRLGRAESLREVLQPHRHVPVSESGLAPAAPP
jgi:hypothetical protein